MVLHKQSLFRVKIYPAPQPAFRIDGFKALKNPWWFSTTGLTPKCARCACCSPPPASDRLGGSWPQLWQLCSNGTVHIAIIQLLRPRITQDVYALADL